jgi:hypothetical protein
MYRSTLYWDQSTCLWCLPKFIGQPSGHLPDVKIKETVVLKCIRQNHKSVRTSTLSTYCYLYLLPFNIGTTAFGVKLVPISPSTTAQVRAFCWSAFWCGSTRVIWSWGHLRIEINMPHFPPVLTALKWLWNKRDVPKQVAVAHVRRIVPEIK